MSKKMLVVISHSTDDVDRANLALAFVAAMVGEEIDVALLLMWEGVLIAKKGVAETLEGRNMTPARDLMPIIMEAGIPILVCGPLCQDHGYDRGGPGSWGQDHHRPVGPLPRCRQGRW